MLGIYREPGVELAYEFLPGAAPVLVFFPGYGSDMTGNKVQALLQAAKARGQAFLRFDYAGHGRSGGEFINGTIGGWAADAACVIREIVPAQPLLLVGSSMGGWISLLLGRDMGHHLAGLLLVAPAPDFTEELIRPGLSPAMLAELEAKGVIYQPGEKGRNLPLTSRFLDDGLRHKVLGTPIPITCPVHILHGMRDDTVPWRTSVTLSAWLDSADVRLTLVKDGDHRLSRPQDLQLLVAALDGLLGQDGG